MKYDAGPLFPGRVVVTAEVEFQGRRIVAYQMADKAAWDYSTGLQEEVKRFLRRKLADEILQVIDPEFTITT